MSNKNEPIAIELAKKQQEISISEFFTKNRHLLGFDNPNRALMMTVKEAVDNSLDACEEMRVLPEISVILSQLSENRIKVIVEDNGPGIVKKQIPNVFAKLLYGSKFHRLSQSRGQQGIGISASVLYSQLTTGKPTKIISKIDPKKPAHYYELGINTKTNEPQIFKEDELSWDKDHGTKIELEIEAKYQKGKQSVDEYIKETAISNPHARLIYTSPDNEKTEYLRVINELPKEAKEIKPHPHGIELGILIKMLHDTTEKTVQSFLQNDFSRIGPGTAREILDDAKIATKKPNDLNGQEMEKLFESLQKAKVIAPSTDCLSPIGEETLEKGLKKEINADFYATTTRSPTVYRGNPFIVECCTGDTQIILEDGSLTPIKKYVERKMLDKKVFSMDSNLKIVPKKVIAVHKFKNQHKILKIRTRTGRELKLTENNEVPIIENGKIIWKEASDLMSGDFIAAPRRLKVLGRIPHILDLLNPKIIKIVDRELVVEIMDILKKKYGSYKASAIKLKINYQTYKAYKRNKGGVNRPTLLEFKNMIDDLGLDFEGFKKRIKSIRIVDNKFTNPGKINLPEINEEFLYLLGLICSDGYLSKSNISFINKDKRLQKEYSKKMQELFGLKVKYYVSEYGNLCNKTLFIVMQKIKEILPTLPDHLIIAWLKGVADGDGYPRIDSRTKHLEGIGICTAKREDAKLVQTLLLRLSIVSKIEKHKPSKPGKINGRLVITKKTKHDIIIEDIKNIKKFISIISFRQTNRANKVLDALIREERSWSDVLPIGSLLVSFRQENNLYQHQFNLSDQSIRQIEKNRQYMTRSNLQELLLEKDYYGESFKELQKLAFSDILWDKIIDIELAQHEDYVYDLTVETGNFVANNIIMHNCGIAYGGDLEKETSVRMMRFANRVPLLYQQGACAITEAVTDINWKAYSLQQSSNSLPVGPVLILIHIASVWVPFTSEAKEAIAHYDEIIKEIKLALQECGRKLGIYIRKTVRAGEQKEKISLFEKYIPELANSLSSLTGEKKELIQIKLQKILKKELPTLELENGAKE